MLVMWFIKKDTTPSFLSAHPCWWILGHMICTLLVTLLVKYKFKAQFRQEF